MTRPLVINADDLGLSAGVNRGIRRAHLEGLVTSTSLLTVARHAADAVAMLHATPTLPVGVHLALVGEDPPLLSAREVPTLVDDQGRFPVTYKAFLARAAAGRVDPDDVRRELAAQVSWALDAGLSPSHLDTHQHLHLWPTVAQAVIELAHRHGIAHVRLPRAHGRGPVSVGVNILSRRLAQRLVAAGLPCTPYAGLDEAGGMDRDAISRAALALLGTGCGPAEINVHPGEDDPEHSRFDWDYRWSDELDALLDPATAATVRGYGFAPESFPSAYASGGQS